MVRSVPLLGPLVAGAEATTRILYAVPVARPAGITALMVRPKPAALLVIVPMFVGVVKLPVASESWAVNVLPAANAHGKSKETVRLVAEPLQKLVPVNTGAVMLGALMVRLVTLENPVMAGLELFTRMR